MAGLADMLSTLVARVADLERRQQNAKRTGVVAEADSVSGRYRVRLKSQGSDGAPFLTPWIPQREIAMGAIKAHIPLSLGEQVTLTSESGELADAEIVGSLPSAGNPRPHDKADEVVLTIGETRLLITGSEVKATIAGATLRLTGAEIKASLGETSLRLTESEMRVESGKIVLAGEVHLGGDGGALLHRKGDKDSAGDTAMESASKVYAV